MKADLAYLTNPGPGVFLLNLKFEGREIERIELTKDQLGNIIADGAGMALRAQAETTDNHRR